MDQKIIIPFVLVAIIGSMTAIFVLPDILNPPNPDLPNLGTAPDFHLVDEDNSTVTIDTYLGKVLLIDFIYTNCPDPEACPVSSLKMKSTQDRIINAGYTPNQIQLISISFDYKYDGPIQMKNYGQNYGANFSYWNFLSGNDTVIDIATDYQVISIAYEEGENETEEFLPFLHTLTLTIVDQDGFIRSRHTGNEWTIDQVFNEVQSLIPLET